MTTKGVNLWASCQIHKIAACACTGNAGNVLPATAGERFRHASRHVRHARAVMHAGSLAVSFEVGGGENAPGTLGECATRNFIYLVRGP